MGRYVLFVMRSVLLFSIVFNLAGCGKESSSSGLSAETFLAQMRQTYASCQTYQDTGVVTTTFSQSSGNWIDEKPFLTAFVRPDRFRFEYKEMPSSVEYRYIIWRNGAEVLSWWDVTPGIKTEDSLSTAIAGATGVSGGSAATIPSLLISDQVGLRFEITQAQRFDDEEINGINCYRIQGNFASDLATIWIDTKTFLIRRIKTQHTFPDFSTETVTTYMPIADGAVADDLLAFNPPQ
jgi:outer membrane lipoprotein-sorting protein